MCNYMPINQIIVGRVGFDDMTKHDFTNSLDYFAIARQFAGWLARYCRTGATEKAVDNFGNGIWRGRGMLLVNHLNLFPQIALGNDKRHGAFRIYRFCQAIGKRQPITKSGPAIARRAEGRTAKQSLGSQAPE